MKKIITILILTIGVTNIYSQEADESWFQIGDKFLENKLYEDCVNYFSKKIDAYKNDPSDFEMDEVFGAPGSWYEYRAEAYLKLNKVDKAIKDYKNVIDNKGYQSDIHIKLAYTELGKLYMNQKNDTETALQYFKNGLEKDYFEILILHNKIKRLIEILNHKIIESPNSFYYYWRAVAQENAKKHEEAIADYTKCQELEPEKGRGYSGISDVYKEQKKYDLAHQYIDKAIKIESKDLNFLISKSQIYTEQEKHELAISTMNKAIAINPKDAGAYYWRAVAQENAKKYDDAYNSIKKAITLTPKDIYLYSKQVDIELSLKSIRNALATADKMIMLFPDKSDGYEYKGKVYIENKDYSNAISMYNLAINKEPESSFLYSKLADIYI